MLESGNLEDRANNAKEKFEELKGFTKLLASIVGDDEPFPKLMAVDMEITDLAHSILETARKDKEICKKALNLMSQVKNLYQDFINENTTKGGGITNEYKIYIISSSYC